MAWQRIDSRHLRRGDPSSPDAVYWDVGQLGSGSLLLWHAAGGRVRGFELPHAKFPGGREYVVEWHAGRGARVGEVDSGEVGADGRKMSPIVRATELATADVVSRMLEYLERNGAELEDSQHHQIATILGELLTDG